MNSYNVYDFDGTIYNGDSSVDLFVFLLFRHPAALAVLPRFLFTVIVWFFKKCSKEQLKEAFFSILRYVPDIENELMLFKIRNNKKIRAWYRTGNHERDIIITASPQFFVSFLLEEYQVNGVIGTIVDPHTGELSDKNCHGEEKVKRLNDKYGNIVIENFYSDSMSDRPLAEQAKQAFFVRRGKPEKWRIS